METQTGKHISGIHHITAIASDPQQNVDFYTGVLGLRLVKITINYDDPSSYHFYYGDETGSPGSILTFFAWPGGYKGRKGTAQATTTAYAVPEDSLGWWRQWLDSRSIAYEQTTTPWNEPVLRFADPDGLRLELVEQPGAEARPAWLGGPIPANHATRGFHGVTLSLRDKTRTAELLTNTMGFRLVGDEGSSARYAAETEGAGRYVELLTLPGQAPGGVGVGSVHHVAWRTPDDAQQDAWLEQLTRQRFQVSPVMDRQYFHSIYFREPGGVLFEIATDEPGFTTDETRENLGTSLRLPDWLEPHRPQIQRGLQPLTLPTTGQAVASSLSEEAANVLQEVR